MDRVRLGKTGLEVSRVGFGGIPIQRLSEEAAVAVVSGCLDLGVTFIDTAHGYTTSEERIGQAIAGRREELVLATKSPARDRATAQEQIELSLRRLGVGRIDIIQLHGVSTYEAMDTVLGPGGALEALHTARDRGQVDHIGFSSHSMEVAQEMIRTGLFETVQFPFNFIATAAADQLVPLAREHDMGFIAMKPMGGGLLERADLAFKYLFQFPGVVPDPGIERVEEMEEIAALAEEEAGPTSDDWAAIEAIRQELGTRFCRRCNYCQPCTQGIPISGILSYRSAWKRMPPERTLGGGWQRQMALAETCVECGECEERCPYGLPIREMLKENVAFFRAELARYEAAMGL
jgi:predicted aldo/keto reductase-like oxidoreductase